MTAFVDLQEREFKAAEERGFTAIKHQREVGAGYFDSIATTVDPNTSTAALKAPPKRVSSTESCPPRLRPIKASPDQPDPGEGPVTGPLPGRRLH